MKALAVVILAGSAVEFWLMLTEYRIQRGRRLFESMRKVNADE